MSSDANDEEPASTDDASGTLDVLVTVGRILALHEAYGGSTFSLHEGDLRGRALFAVSIFPERGRVVDPVTVDFRSILTLFIEANLDLLNDPRTCVGTWLNDDDGLVYLDIVATLTSVGEAERLARAYNQIAIFDLARAVLIDTGGSGEPPLDSPPPRDRLPPG